MTPSTFTTEDLRRILDGDASDIDRLENRQAEIVAAADLLPTAALTLKPAAVRRVLMALNAGKISPAQAQAWASFMRRGFVRSNEQPVRPIDIRFDPEREEEIAEAVSRMDELGEAIDGRISPAESLELVASLS